MNTLNIDLHRQLLAALIIQNGGELRVQQSALNAERAGMDIVQGIDDESGDIVLRLEHAMQEA